MDELTDIRAAWDFEWGSLGTHEEEADEASKCILSSRRTIPAEQVRTAVMREIVLYRETYSDSRELEGLSDEAMAIVNRLCEGEAPTEASVIADLLRLRALEVGDGA